MYALNNGFLCLRCDVAWLRRISEECWLCGEKYNFALVSLAPGDPRVKEIQLNWRSDV